MNSMTILSIFQNKSSLKFMIDLKNESEELLSIEALMMKELVLESLSSLDTTQLLSTWLAHRKPLVLVHRRGSLGIQKPMYPKESLRSINISLKSGQRKELKRRFQDGL